MPKHDETSVGLSPDLSAGEPHNPLMFNSTAGRAADKVMRPAVAPREPRPARHWTINEDEGTSRAGPRGVSPKRRNAIGAAVLVGGLGLLAFAAWPDQEGSAPSGAPNAERGSVAAGQAPAVPGQPAGELPPGEVGALATADGATLPPGFEPLPPELPIPADYRQDLPSVPAQSAAPTGTAAAPAAGEAGQTPAETAAAPTDAAPSASASQATNEPLAVAEAEPPPSAPAATASSTVAVPPPAVADRTTGARYLAGGLLNSDNPRGQFQGTVSVRFTVEPSGQVTGCRPLVSSGNPALDGRTCLLVEQRLRFAPALDRQGRPVASEIRASYTWGRRQRRR